MTRERKQTGGRKKKCGRCGSGKTKRIDLLGSHKVGQKVWVCQDCHWLMQR